MCEPLPLITPGAYVELLEIPRCGAVTGDSTQHIGLIIQSNRVPLICVMKTEVHLIQDKSAAVSRINVRAIFLQPSIRKRAYFYSGTQIKVNLCGLETTIC